MDLVEGSICRNKLCPRELCLLTDYAAYRRMCKLPLKKIWYLLACVLALSSWLAETYLWTIKTSNQSQHISVRFIQRKNISQHQQQMSLIACCKQDMSWTIKVVTFFKAINNHNYTLIKCNSLSTNLFHCATSLSKMDRDRQSRQTVLLHS